MRGQDMSNKFNLALAKAGKPIQYCPSGNIWVDCKFIGMNSEGFIVLEGISWKIQGYGTYPSNYLRMKPTKRIVWVNIYINNRCFYYENEELANRSSDGSTRIGSKAWPLEIEE